MRQYIIDAFADRVFEGNPAAVCVLDSWPEEARMMDITRENNLSETAFAVPEGEGYRLRWFTPGGEIDLCGHATLAAAYVIFHFVTPEAGEVWRARDLLCVFDRAEDVLALKPDMEKLRQVKGALMQVTAPGDGAFDCVSRSFAPKMGVPEDPVCGSGHCHIIPYWAARTGRREFVARQASPRGGTLYCRLEGDRVFLAGRAVVYAQSELMVEGIL